MERGREGGDGRGAEGAEEEEEEEQQERRHDEEERRENNTYITKKGKANEERINKDVE